jgi:hypothetical protein
MMMMMVERNEEGDGGGRRRRKEKRMIRIWNKVLEETGSGRSECKYTTRTVHNEKLTVYFFGFADNQIKLEQCKTNWSQITIQLKRRFDKK